MIVAVGLSHRDAPIDIREHLAIDKEQLPELLARLVARPAVSEAAVLSTCNRVEVYAVALDGTDAGLEAAASDLVRELDDWAALHGGVGFARHLKRRVGADAVLHLFRVASSLDSLVIGEPQILGQVKDALEHARASRSVGRYLERAMSKALHVAKRVRTETAVGAGQVSVASIAVDLARQIFGDLTGRAAVLLGAGEMAEGAARALIAAGARLIVVNRSRERGESLAADMGGTYRPWEQLVDALVEADVVVASTSARGFVVTRPMVASIAKARRGKSLFFVDIAVPRDVEPAVNELENVYLYDVDDLAQVVSESMRERRVEAERAERLVAHEAAQLAAWVDSLQVTPTVVALRAQVRRALAAEIDRSLAGRLKHLPEDDRRALALMADAAVNRVLHTPVTRLRALAGEARADDAVQLIEHLFALPDVEVASGAAADEPEAPAPPTPPAHNGSLPR